MRQFDYSELADRTWDNEIISYISKIHEYKGKQELFLRQKPVELDRLIELAKVQSTEASNRIEGIITTNSRLKQLVADKTTPRNRDEEEILGYRNALNLIHENYDAIPVRRNYILQLHKELLAYTNLSFAGQFKTTPNEIDMITADGEKKVLFRPPQPYEILLLNKCGYLVGQYISIEKAIADTKEAYYDSLQRADLNWHEGTNDPKPFIKYMLGIILACYRDFENRVYIVHGAGAKSTSYDIVKACVTERIGKFSKQEILALCPSLGSSSVESALKKLVDEGYLVRLGSGRKTMYVRTDALR